MKVNSFHVCWWCWSLVAPNKERRAIFTKEKLFTLKEMRRMVTPNLKWEHVSRDLFCKVKFYVLIEIQCCIKKRGSFLKSILTFSKLHAEHQIILYYTLKSSKKFDGAPPAQTDDKCFYKKKISKQVCYQK